MNIKQICVTFIYFCLPQNLEMFDDVCNELIISGPPMLTSRNSGWNCIAGQFFRFVWNDVASARYVSLETNKT